MHDHCDTLTCRNYHTEFVSGCCGASVTQVTLDNGKPLTIPFQSLLREKGTVIAKGHVITYPHVCDNCHKKCSPVARHTGQGGSNE